MNDDNHKLAVVSMEENAEAQGQQLMRQPRSGDQLQSIVVPNVASHAALKVSNSLAKIQNLTDPYVSGATAVMDEQELCCMAMRLDEVVSRMQSRVVVGQDPSLALLPSSGSSSLSHEAAWPSRGNHDSLLMVPSTNSTAAGHDLLLRTPPTAGRPRLSDAMPDPSNSPPSLPTYGTIFDAMSHLSEVSPAVSHGEEQEPLVDGRLTTRPPGTPTADLALKDAALRVFDEIDKNKDGFLDRDEVKEAFCHIEHMDERFKRILQADTYAASLIDAGDLNGDGKIDKKEFLRMVKIGALHAKQEPKEKATPGANAMMESSRFASSFFVAPRNKHIETETLGTDLWLIHPNSTMNLVWSGLVSILIVVVMCTMPLAFGWRELGGKLVVYNTIIDFIFQVDIVKTFFTGMVDEDDSVLMDAKKIRSKYFKGFFALDILSSLPLDLIFFLFRVGHGTTKNSLKLSKLMLIFKLLRFRRIRQVFDLAGAVSSRFEEMLNIRISDGIAKITYLFLLTLMIAHWIGCFQFMLVEAFDYPEDSWVVYAGLENEPATVQWSWSLFKALAQMILLGFETPPFTNGSCDTYTHWCRIEHWVTLICLYGGAIFYSFLISFMLEIIQTTYFACRAFEMKFTEIDGWMRSNKMPNYLRQRVKKNFRAMHAGKFYDRAVLQLVDPKDLADIHRIQAEQLLNKIPCFMDLKEKNTGLLKDLSHDMERVAMSKNELIFDEGTHGETVLFIERGLVELYLPSSDIPHYRVIGERCFFGEVSPLFGTARTTAARVRQDCVLYQIGSEEFMAVLGKYPEAAKTLKKVAYERINRVQCYRNPAPEDLASAKEDDIDAQDARVA